MTEAQVREILTKKLLHTDDAALAPLNEMGGADIVICPGEISVHPPFRNGVPASIYFGVCRVISLSWALSRDAIEALIDKISSLLATAANGADEVWDGSRWVGNWSEEAFEAYEEAFQIVEQHYNDNVNMHAEFVDAYNAVTDGIGYSFEDVLNYWRKYYPEEAKKVEQREYTPLAEKILEEIRDSGFEVSGGLGEIVEVLERLHKEYLEQQEWEEEEGK